MRIPLALFALLSSPLLAQDADLVLQMGQQLPGRPPIRNVGSTAVISSGSWAALIADQPGCNGCGPLACVQDGVVVAEPGMTLASGYTLPAGGTGPIALDLAESGELLLEVRTAGSDKTLLWDGWPILSDGDPLPFSGLPPGSTLTQIVASRVASGGRVALVGRSISGGNTDFFVARLDVSPAGIQNFDLIAITGQPIGQSSHQIASVADIDDHDRFDLDESGAVLWVPSIVGFLQFAVFLDDEPLIVHGQPGPLAGSTYIGNTSLFAGIGGGSWAAVADLDLPGPSTTKVLVRDGALVARLGDDAPDLAPGRYVAFRAPLRPLPGGGVLFGGSVGGYRTGIFDDAGHALVQRDNVDESRLYLAPFEEGSAVSADGRYVTERTQFGGFEGVYLLDRQGTDENPCALGDDAFEPNDTCSQAAPLALGAEPALLVTRTDPDWYRFDVPAGAEFSAHARFPHADADVDLRVFAGACGSLTLVDASTSASDGERVFVRNAGPGSVTCWLEVAVASTSLGDCARYRLDLRDDPGVPCSTVNGPLDDAFEDNDRPDAAFALAQGAYTGLYASWWDEDWFTITVGPGETLRVVVDNAGSGAPCARLFSGADLNEQLDDSFVISSGLLVWFNASSAPRDVLLAIEPCAGSSSYEPDGCVTYDLDVMTSQDGLGTTFCPPSANSTGWPALVYAAGSTSVGADSLRVVAFTVPDQPGYFVYGDATQQAQVANGTLCVAPGASGIFRLPVELPVDGVLSHALELDSPPAPAGQITAGSTWHFQCWYRDPAAGGGNANFSEAVTLSFTP